MPDTNRLAQTALDIGAIKINPEDPFTWASGYRMPIYNDNRLLLANPEHRSLIAESFRAIIQSENISVDVIAGTATAGIPHATTLADLMKKPLIYVRNSPKAHGMGNQVEGNLHKGQSVVVVEDLVSTGGSAMKAVEAVRNAGGNVDHCLCIFHYGFEEAEKVFQKEGCQIYPLLTYKSLIAYALQSGSITKEQNEILASWSENPFNWGNERGFPKK